MQSPRTSASSTAALHDDPGLGPGLRLASATQPQGTPATPDDRAQEFVPVKGGTDTTSAGTLLVAAYLVMWAILIGFLLMSWRRGQRLAVRIDDLEKTLDRADKARPEDD